MTDFPRTRRPERPLSGIKPETAFDPVRTFARSPYHQAVRIALLLITFGLAIGFASYAESKTRVWPCSWTHGRMTAGNGTPAIRIWPRGTHRLLGVVNLEHPIADDAYAPTLPDHVSKLFTRRNDFTVWGDFYVCPVAPERAGWMRFVIVKQARRLVLEPE